MKLQRLAFAIPSVVALAVLFPAGCTDSVAPADPLPREEPPPGPLGPEPPDPNAGPPAIAFVSTRDGLPHIYVASADGTGVRRLTSGEAPAWSWDGRRIAFHRGLDNPGPAGIYTMNPDGSDLRFLVEGGQYPAWSPDGRIAFNTSIWGEGGILVMHEDGSDVRLILSHEWAREFNYVPGYGTDAVSRPAWSPDGGTIAFWLYAGYMGVHSVGVMSADGSEPRDLQEGVIGSRPSTWGRPAWSPDGSRIAVLTTPVVSVFDVASLGRESIHLSSPWFLSNPEWSPDGDQLAFDAFASTEPGPDSPSGSRRRIFSVSRTTGQVRQLIPEANASPQNDYADYEATWSRGG